MTTNYEWLALLHFDGADGGTTFTDECGRGWASNGSATLTTTAPKFGTACLNAAGAAAGGIGAVANQRAQFHNPGIPTTVDFWFRTTATTQYSCLYSANGGGGGFDCLINGIATNDGKIACNSTVSGVPFLTSSGGWNDGDFHHGAVVYNPFSSDATRYWQLFIDGHEEAISNSVSSASSFTQMEIAACTLHNRGLVGQIDEFAWRSGAVWTADFTPPSAPYTIAAPTGADIRTVPLMPRRVP